MAPILSPKKSIEGAVGGVLGSALLTAIFTYIFKDAMNIDTTEIIVLSCGAMLGALISMIGDLAASAIKRNNDIKDYGKLIPGHGGILDRFDSVIITAPIIFYLGGFI
jgi:phosphatidate cytidylyltransferase